MLSEQQCSCGRAQEACQTTCLLTLCRQVVDLLSLLLTRLCSLEVAGQLTVAAFECVQENPHGFFPIRDPSSKWYIPRDEMPDDVVPWKQR